MGIYYFQEFEKDENFELILESVSTQGAKLGRLNRTVVTIVNDDGMCPKFGLSWKQI